MAMDKAECQSVLGMYASWNTEQVSISTNPEVKLKENQLLDARRDLLLTATKRLTELVTGE